MEPASIENLGTGIEVRSLYFRYSDVEPWLLENVSFRIEANECVAIYRPFGRWKIDAAEVNRRSASAAAGRHTY